MRFRESRTACFIGISGRSVKDHAINDCLDQDASAHELAYCIGHVLVVSTQAIKPAHDKGVALPQDIEKPPAVRAFTEATGDARDAESASTRSGVNPTWIAWVRWWSSV